jgi:hypothetical protein
MRICSARIIFAVALLSLLSFIGCGDSESSAPSSGNAPASAGASTGPKAGYATGKVLHQNGKPIDAKGAKITVDLDGISTKSGEKVNYTPKVNADGSYEQKLVDGTYRFGGAWILVPFDGKQFRFDLEPVGDDKSDRDSDKGIVQDYVWKVSGLKAGQEDDPANFTHWHGSSINMQFNFYREDIKKGVPKPPAGTKCVFTVTPVGKLVDGTDGKPLTFEREFDEHLSGLKNGNLPDIPLGVYTVSGEEVHPDGSKKPLRIQQAYAKFGDSTEVHFAPGTGSGTWPANVGFTRDE